jgi:hypoxanthine phosphoribosyltransferase
LPDRPVPGKPGVDGQPLIWQEAIEARNRTVFRHIRNDLEPFEFILVLYITHGSTMTVYQLLDEMRAEGVVSHAVHAKSYYGAERKGISVNLNDLHPSMLDFCQAILMDDIVDSGTTISTVRRSLKDLNPNCRVKTYALLQKRGVLAKHNRLRQIRCEEEVALDYLGFDIPDDAFVIGRGMDYYGFGRRHKCVYTLEDWSRRFPKDRAAADRLRDLLPKGDEEVNSLPGIVPAHPSSIANPPAWNVRL